MKPLLRQFVAQRVQAIEAQLSGQRVGYEPVMNQGPGRGGPNPNPGVPPNPAPLPPPNPARPPAN